MVEQDAKTAARSRFQGSHGGLSKVFRTTALGRGQATVMVSFHARLPGAEGALLFRVSSAHGATHRQDLSQR